MDMSISFEGIGEVMGTFACQEGVAAGDAVAVTGDGQVGRAADGGLFCGKAVIVSDDGMAGIQLGGLCQLSYTGTAPAPGFVRLAGNGAGGVKVVASDGVLSLVVSVDSAAKTAVVKL